VHSGENRAMAKETRDRSQNRPPISTPHSKLRTRRHERPLGEEQIPSLERLQEFVFQHGTQYDSYLATEPEHELFWSRNEQGLISYARWGRHLLVRGGLIAPEEQKRQLLQEFLDYARPLRLNAYFFGIHEADLPYFRETGYRITKLGEDAIVDLGNVTFAGKKFEWVRRQVNYCQRHGLVASEAGPHLQSPEDWQATLDEVIAICEKGLDLRPQREELKFFDGRIGEHELGRRRLFIARADEGRGRIEGFVVCNPMLGGRMWSTEIYRHRNDEVRGTVPFLFHHLILALQEEGAEQVNLCIVPARNALTPLPGDNPVIRRGLGVAHKYFRGVFNLQGIDHFKSRFRPRYESRYICGAQRPQPGAFVATISVFGVLRLDYRKAARLAWSRLCSKLSRTRKVAAE
jgi:phosphatidylglycerol lysyltransferase